MVLVEEVPNEKYYSYKIKDLLCQNAYYVKVTAVNKIGEGYHPKQLQIFNT